MSDTYLISDLHLSAETPALERGLYAFLERIAGAQALYILGDFFEAWIGDDDDAPLVARVREKVRRLSDQGCAVFIMRGNRDFLLGEQFAQACGARLLPDTQVLDLAGTSTLLLHGDTLCTDDTDYLQFRAMAHDPSWQQSVLQKPLGERRELAVELRAMSQDAASNKAEDIMDVNDQSVAETAAAWGVTRIIHGHTHRPYQHRCAWGERWVLGDWSTTGWCIHASDSEISLQEFPI